MTLAERLLIKGPHDGLVTSSVYWLNASKGKKATHAKLKEKKREDLHKRRGRLRGLTREELSGKSEATF